MHLAYFHYLIESDTAMHHVRQFVAAARALGHRVDVYPMNLAPNPSGNGRPLGRASLKLRTMLKRSLGRYLHEPKELIWNVRYMRKEEALLRRARPDVLLVRDHHFTISSIFAAKHLKLPLVFEMNSPVEESSLYLNEYFHLPLVPSWLEGYKLRHANAATVVSSKLKRHLQSKYGVPEAKLTVVPNGADPRIFHPETRPDPEIAERLRGGPIIGFVGSYHPWHGSDLLCRVLRDVSSARPRARYLLVGDGSEAGPIRKLAASLRERAIFTGRVPHDRIPGLVAALDIGVMPESNFYGSPLKVIEWMMAGKAIVAPRYEPLQDVIQDGVQGLLFRPKDEDELVATIVRLIDDGGLRRKLGQAAAAKARLSLSWEANATQVIQACEGALNRAGIN